MVRQIINTIIVQTTRFPHPKTFSTIVTAFVAVPKFLLLLYPVHKQPETV